MVVLVLGAVLACGMPIGTRTVVELDIPAGCEPAPVSLGVFGADELALDGIPGLLDTAELLALPELAALLAVVDAEVLRLEVPPAARLADDDEADDEDAVLFPLLLALLLLPPPLSKFFQNDGISYRLADGTRYLALDGSRWLAGWATGVPCSLS